MAAVVVVMLPPLPPPAPVPRISRLALAAADAVVCLWIASLWALLASVAAVIIDHLACGCAGAAWAGTAALVSFIFAVVVWPLGAMLVLGIFAEPFYTDQLEKGAAALEPISKAVIEAHFTAIVAFLLIEAFGLLLKLLALASADPLANRTASVIMVVPPLGISVMCCLVTIPGLAVRLWRVR